MRKIIRLSEPAPVNMTDHWHDIASLDHFWIRRRWEVLTCLLERTPPLAGRVADIGCGCGLLQRQLEGLLARGVDGFDLDEKALMGNVSTISNVYLYNVHDRSPDLAHTYSSIFMFDVLEHVEDQQEFLCSVLHHLCPGGRIYLNLPAYDHLYSSYDVFAGHLRRYTLESAIAEGVKAGMSPVCATYWGAPYYPLLLIRKLMLASSKHEKNIVKRGFAASKGINTLLGVLGRLESIPQSVVGTSVMVVFQSPG